MRWRLVLSGAVLGVLALNGGIPRNVGAADETAPKAAATWDDLPPVRPGAGDWPWWRGPNFDSIAAAPQRPPLRWNATENVIWKADVPGRGHSTPCIWGGRIFLPTADDKAQAQYVLCYDAKNGEKLWQTQVHSGGFMRLNPKNSHASSTPACDGERVFVPFIVQGGIWLTALDLEGKIAWQKKLGAFQSMHGFAASPVLYRSLAIVVADHLKDSYIVALHRRTGEVVWRINRPDYNLGTYASPVVGRVAGRDQLLIQGPNKVFSYDPGTGNLLWTCDGPSESASATVSFDSELVWAAAGFPKRNLLCIRGDGNGDVTKTHIVWKKENNMTYVPSLLLADGLLYMVADEGKVTCFEAKTGQVVWEGKLRGAFSSSPVLAGGHIYVVNEAGVMFVFKPGRTFELVAESDLADGGFATPVSCGGRIYLRTLHRFYCLGTPK
ncbi:MAG: PQQ-binding-like beta-propeller repeat protein [Planctomycetota bacterium]|nr:PQQ-binding-like beta-propeller repeat protein [Planctomycetota bacterium]